MASSFMEQLTAPIRSGARNFFNRLNPLSQVRATRRFATRFMDEEVAISDPNKLPGFFYKFTRAAIEKGDTPQLDKGAHQFESEVLKIIKVNENAQYGVLIHIRDTVSDLRKRKREFTGNIDRAVREKGLTPSQAQEIKKIIEEEFTFCSHMITKALDEIERQEIMVARERTQLRSFLFKFDMTLKQEMGFFYNRILDLDKSMAKDLNVVGKDIAKTVRGNASKNQQAKQILNKDLAEIHKLVEKEMKLIMDEVRDLIHLTLGVENGIKIIMNREVIGNLEGQMKLPKAVGDKIIAYMKLLEDEIQKTSEVNYQYSKTLELQARGI